MHFNIKRPKFFYGWYLVGASLLITLYISGIANFGFTALFEPIAEQFGWSYAQISLASSLRGLEMGLFAPIVGLLVDRLGPRRLVFGGGILVGIGFWILSLVSSLGMFYGAFALISVGMSASVGTVLIATVGNWFRKRVGMAMGIVVSGFGLGGLLVPLVTRLVDTLHWQVAMLIFALGTLVLVLPLSLVLRHKPELYGYQPDGEIDDQEEAGEAQIAVDSTDITVRVEQTLRSRAFWQMAVASMCHAFVISAAITHVMPLL